MVETKIRQNWRVRTSGFVTFHLGIRTRIIQLKMARTRPESDPLPVFCTRIILRDQKENCITLVNIFYPPIINSSIINVPVP
jgi:hypothetical protein